MRSRWLVFGLLLFAQHTLSAQARLRVAGFGFGAGAAAMQGMNTAAQLSINLRMTADARAFELRAGSAVADLQSGAGFQRDKFVEATALSSLRRHLLAGAGLGLHSFASNIRGVGSQTTRPALNALVGARLPLAPDGSALLELAARGALMRSAHEFSLVLSMQLAPQRGGLLLGERSHVQQQFIEANGSWDNIVEEVMLQEETLPQLLDVIATGSTLVMKFADGPNVALAVSRVARVLNGSSDRIELAIHAPDPLMVAAAATAGGFPPERISTFKTERDITVQATRRLPVTASRSAQQ